MGGKLQTLPIGIQSFEMLRRRGHLYVDKTARLMELVSSDRCFLSRPRRFGKSLTLSTLDAMFQGKAELFEGLAAEAWVAERAKRPCPVLRLDMRTMDVRGVPEFESSLVGELARRGDGAGVQVKSTLPGGALKDLVIGLYKAGGPVVVLIDEYDKPILDNIGDLEAADAMRGALRAFYTVLKGYNTALSGIPYQDFTQQDESLYRSLFLMLLRGAGITAQGEVPTNRGRSDVLVLFPERVVVLEFKLARSAGEVARLREEGRRQIGEKGYAKPYDAEGRAVTSAVVVVDAKKREAVPLENP